jgi:adenylate cyclase class IV
LNKLLADLQPSTSFPKSMTHPTITELEVKILDVDPEALTEKIKSIGGQQILDDITEVETFDFPHDGLPVDCKWDEDLRKECGEVIDHALKLSQRSGTLDACGAYLRLRREGAEYQFTLKYPIPGQNAIKHEQEVHCIIAEQEWSAIRSCLLRLGMTVQFHLQKKRTSLILPGKSVRFDIDTWLNTPIPSYVEIEGPDAHAIEQAIQLIGFAPKDATAISGKALFQRYNVIPGRI